MRFVSLFCFTCLYKSGALTMVKATIIRKTTARDNRHNEAKMSHKMLAMHPIPANQKP